MRVGSNAGNLGDVLDDVKGKLRSMARADLFVQRVKCMSSSAGFKVVMIWCDGTRGNRCCWRFAQIEEVNLDPQVVRSLHDARSGLKATIEVSPMRRKSAFVERHPAAQRDLAARTESTGKQPNSSGQRRR